jgi:hypothetical protein
VPPVNLDCMRKSPTVNRPSGVPVACRLRARDLVVVDAAARRAGVPRATYLARAVVERALADLDPLRQPTRRRGGER